MFPMSITLTNPAQLNAVMLALNIGAVPSEVAAKAVPEKAQAVAPAKKTQAVAPTAEAAAPAPTAPAEAAAAPAPKVEPSEPPPACTYEDTAKAVQHLAKTKGRDAAVAVLAQFGATKLPEVKPAQFADVLAACQAAGA